MMNRKGLVLGSFLALGLVSTWVIATESPATTTAVTSTETAELNDSEILRLSEAFGHLIGENLDNPGLTFNVESVITGIRNAVDGKESPMTEGEYAETMARLQQSAFSSMAEENLAQANSFIEMNAKREAVQTIEEGKLLYEVLTAGEGKTVEPNSAPTIHYLGTYSDGTVFGSSEDGGGPITLPLDQTIAGFNKGLVGMKKGEKRRLYIHPDLGYGTTGHLPPNSLLVFDVEIVSLDGGDTELEMATIGADTDSADAIAEVNTNTEVIQ